MNAVAVDIGVFAHNEARGIGAMLSELAAQTVFDDDRFDARVVLLANGCSDDTVRVAGETVATLSPERARRFTVVDMPPPGKSRTWNAFVHQHARDEAAFLVMADGDIRLPDRSTIAAMLAALSGRPELRVFSSRPVKDLETDPRPLGFVERLILSGSGELNDWRKSICGQLYAIRGPVARRIWMPVGLPVEDGFLRAMALTDFLTDMREAERIDGDPAISHVYESLRTLPAVIRHQIRIVIGSAVNTALFGLIRRDAPTADAAAALLREAADDEAWLARALRAELPRPPYGYVPFHFLLKRTRLALSRGAPSLKALPRLFGGLAFDLVVFAAAQAAMARGKAAGYW